MYLIALMTKRSDADSPLAISAINGSESDNRTDIRDIPASLDPEDVRQACDKNPGFAPEAILIIGPNSEEKAREALSLVSHFRKVPLYWSPSPDQASVHLAPDDEEH